MFLGFKRFRRRCKEQWVLGGFEIKGSPFGWQIPHMGHSIPLHRRVAIKCAKKEITPQGVNAVWRCSGGHISVANPPLPA